MAQAKFEIFKDAKDEFRFRLVAPNGEIVAASQGYNAKASCTEGVAAVRQYASTARMADLTAGQEGGLGPKFEIFKDAKDEFRFRLVAPNGEIVAASQGYNAKVSCIEGIESLRRYSSDAALVDSTRAEPRTPRAALHGQGWVVMCRLVQFHYFRGAWWRDTLTGNAKRRFPSRCR